MLTPSILKLALIVVYALMSASGLGLMKANNDQFNLLYILGFAIYGLAFCIWLFAILPALPLSIAFPVSAGAIVIMTLLVGHFTLGEPATLAKIAGSALIMAGIALAYVPGGQQLDSDQHAPPPATGNQTK